MSWGFGAREEVPHAGSSDSVSFVTVKLIRLLFVKIKFGRIFYKIMCFTNCKSALT